MTSVSGRSISLNPNAPLFIPSVFRVVEDFSPEWWELIKNSPWFRDYWLSHNQEDDFDCTVGDNYMTNTLLESCDVDTAEEFTDLEAEFENMVLSIAEKPEPIQTVHKDTDDLKGSEMDVKKVLKDLAIPKSPKKRGPKSPVSPAKFNVKPAKCASPKYTPRIIHQPR